MGTWVWMWCGFAHGHVSCSDTNVVVVSLSLAPPLDFCSDFYSTASLLISLLPFHHPGSEATRTRASEISNQHNPRLASQESSELLCAASQTQPSDPDSFFFSS